jgi:hypothetical protein
VTAFLPDLSQNRNFSTDSKIDFLPQNPSTFGMSPHFIQQSPFQRQGSTLGVMDDLQIAVHSYDGCGRGCSGCVVDKHFKNDSRGQGILLPDQLDLIQRRTLEYYDWTQHHLNTKDTGYFGSHGFKINHYSYTFRFGNHSELPEDVLIDLATRLQAPYRVFSTAPSEDLSVFSRVQQATGGRYFLEIIYDPVADPASLIRNMILEMRGYGILGYPEVLLTRRLLDHYSPEKFVREAVAPLGDLGTQMQFGRYSPSKTRSFNTRQVVPLDEEVVWLTEVARLICEQNLNIHPIPIAEYAVTFLDEYHEWESMTYDPSGRPLGVDDTRLPSLPPTDWENVKAKTRDIFRSSLYIDHNLDLFVWSESMGQHVLDRNFGFPSLGSLKTHAIHELVRDDHPVMERMLNQTLRHLMTHPKCGSCRYQSFCASHAIPFFRHWHPDDGAHCYGYLPTIREFQKHPIFLKNMVDGFKTLDF